MCYNRLDWTTFRCELKLATKDDDAGLRKVLDEHPELRMGLLTFLLVQKDTEAAARIAYSLVAYGEEWGERLGWNMLESAYFSAEVKMAAAEALRYGLAPARLRREKEKQLIEYLSRKENLDQAISELSEEDIELLQVLLRKDGWSRIGAITRKFGSLEGDGFHWEVREPESPLGYLWLGCIVMVGRAAIEGKRAKIVTIPVKLREPLKEILGELF